MAHHILYPVHLVRTPSEDEDTQGPGGLSLAAGDGVSFDTTRTGTGVSLTISAPGSGGTASNTVVAETSYGLSTSAGTASEYARGDHSHGSPALPTPAAIGAAPAAHLHTIVEVTGLATALAGKESTISSGTTAQYWRGDKSWQTLPKYADISSYRQAGTSPLEIWYVANAGNGTAMTTGAPGAGVLRALPFVAPARGGTLDRIAFNVTTPVAGNARLGLYTNGSDSVIYPNSLVFDSGDIATGTGGAIAASCSVNLTPGALYWVVHIGNVAAGLRCLAVGGTSALLGSPPGLGGAFNAGIAVTMTYGALPSSFPGGGATFSAAPIPALAFRFSA